MNIERKRQHILDSFFISVSKYKEVIRYASAQKNVIFRVAYNIHRFGTRYVFYHSSRLRIPIFVEHIHATLFFGRGMLLPARDIGGSVLSMYGISPHKSERRLTLWLIKNLKESDIFYDVGAHLGYYTALSEELVMDGEVHAFEANKYLCTYLEKNFLKSSCVHVSRSAVADHIGEVDFYDASDTDDSSTSSRFHLSQSSITPSKVTAITLDEYVRLGNIPPTVLKLDIEGGESDAILGALEVIKIYKPRIAMDVWGGDMGRKYSSPAVKKLQDYGYQAFALDGNGDISKESIADPVMSISDTSEGARGNFVFLI